MPQNIYLTPAFLEDNLAQGVKPDTLADFISSNVPAFRDELNSIKIRSNNDPRAVEAFLTYKAYGTTNPESRVAPMSAPSNTYDPAEHQMGPLRSAAQFVSDVATAPGELATGGIMKGLSNIPGMEFAGSDPSVQNIEHNLDKTVDQLPIYGGIVGSAVGQPGLGAGLGAATGKFVDQLRGKESTDLIDQPRQMLEVGTEAALGEGLDIAFKALPGVVKGALGKAKPQKLDALARQAARFDTADDFVNAMKDGKIQLSPDDILPPKSMPEGGLRAHASKAPPPAKGFEDMPIEVTREGGKFRLVDGAHRVEQAMREGKGFIEARITDTADDQMRELFEAAKPSSKVTKMVQPKATEKLIQETAQTNPELVQKGSFFKKGGLLPTGQEKQIAQEVAQVPGVNPRKDIIHNMKAVDDGIESVAETVGQRLKGNDAIFPTKELSSALNKAKAKDMRAFGNEQTAENAYQGILNVWTDVKSRFGNNLSGLWKARKAFDQELQRQFGKKVFDPTMEKPIHAAVRSVRQTVNQFVETRANQAGTSFLPEIHQMSQLYQALENMATKTGAKTLESGFTKAIKTPVGRVAASAALGGAAAGLGYGAVHQ